MTNTEYYTPDHVVRYLAEQVGMEYEQLREVTL